MLTSAATELEDRLADIAHGARDDAIKPITGRFSLSLLRECLAGMRAMATEIEILSKDRYTEQCRAERAEETLDANTIALVREMKRYRKRAELAEASLAQVRAAQAWQPIATAPKDKAILVGVAARNWREGLTGFDVRSNRHPAHIWVSSWWTGDALNEPRWHGVVAAPPTHWMPLPDPPQALAASEQP